jgi:hypothetical protein
VMPAVFNYIRKIKKFFCSGISLAVQQSAASGVTQVQYWQDYQENTTKLYHFSTFFVQMPNSYRKYGRFKGTVSAKKSALSCFYFGLLIVTFEG